MTKLCHNCVLICHRVAFKSLSDLPKLCHTFLNEPTSLPDNVPQDVTRCYTLFIDCLIVLPGLISSLNVLVAPLNYGNNHI